MLLTFPNIGNAVQVVGRTPWSARVPLDPLLANRIRVARRARPTRASAADQGVRPTTGADCAVRGKVSGIGLQPAVSRRRTEVRRCTLKRAPQSKPSLATLS